MYEVRYFFVLFMLVCCWIDILFLCLLCGVLDPFFVHLFWALIFDLLVSSCDSLFLVFLWEFDYWVVYEEMFVALQVGGLNWLDIRVWGFCFFFFLVCLGLRLFLLLVVGLVGIFLSICLVRLLFFFVLWSFQLPVCFLIYHSLFLLSILGCKVLLNLV